MGGEIEMQPIPGAPLQRSDLEKSRNTAENEKIASDLLLKATDEYMNFRFAEGAAAMNYHKAQNAEEKEVHRQEWISHCKQLEKIKLEFEGNLQSYVDSRIAAMQNI